MNQRERNRTEFAVVAQFENDMVILTKGKKVIKQTVNDGFQLIGAFVGNISSIASALILLIITCCLITLYGSQEAFAFGPQEINFQQINGGLLDIGTMRTRMIFFSPEHGDDGSNNLIKFFSLVSTDSQPISDKQTSQERGGAQPEGSHWFHWWMIPILWFVIGVALGGGFGDWNRRSDH